MNIAHIEECSFIYGPGKRFVIWVQGCSIRCKGCWNKDMWDFTPKIVLTVDELINKILKEKENIEGITFLGGEPLDQYEEVKELLIKSKILGLTNMLFTGYEMDEIIEKKMTSIIEYLDILITGRYDKNKRTTKHQWIGSSNQKIYFLTERYSEYLIKNANYTEISIDLNGNVTVFGFPEKTILDILIK
jgi:anaerobic ribonucleoside-triphosphate reductase activating protein